MTPIEWIKLQTKCTAHNTQIFVVRAELAEQSQ